MLAEFFDILNCPELAERYNIAPTSAKDRNAVDVRKHILAIKDNYEAAFFNWGIAPVWAKGSQTLINARADGVATKRTFSKSFKERRCLVIADGYFEWQELPDKTTQPIFVHLPDHRPFAIAGIWERCGTDEIDSCAVITTSPCKSIAHLHDRMPVIIEREDIRHWFAEPAEDLLKPFEGDIKFHAVSNYVNKVSNQEPTCIEPVAKQNVMF